MAVTLVVLSGSVLAPDGVAITSGHIRAKLSQPGSTLDGAVSQRVATEANGTITAGVVAMSIVPNDVITPSGTYYVAVYDCKAANGKAYRWSEKWQLTSDDLTLDIGAVPRLEVVPGVALQTSSSVTPITATGTTTARTIGDRFVDSVNVKDFGAVGDGVADDTAAIQSAVTLAGATKTTVFPGGTYRITSTVNLVNGSRLDGYGSTIRPDSTVDAPVFRAFGDSLSYWERIEVSGFHFDGVNKVGTPLGGWLAIHLFYCRDVILQDLSWFQGHDGLYLRAVEDFRVTGLRAHDMTAGLVTLLKNTKRGVISDLHGTDCDEIVDFYANEDIAISNFAVTGNTARADEAFDISTSRRISISNGVATGFVSGVHVKTEAGQDDPSLSWEDILVSNVTIREHASYGVLAQAADLTYGPARRIRLENVTIVSAESGSSGVVLSPPASGAGGTDATFDNLIIDTPGIGIDTYQFQRVKITNCVITTATGTAVRVLTAVPTQDLQVSGCRLVATGGVTTDATVVVSEGNDVRIERNVVSAATGSAINCTNCQRPMVLHNTILGAGMYGITMVWTALAKLDVRRAGYIAGNTISNWGTAATNRGAVNISFTGITATAEGLEVTGNIARISDSGTLNSQYGFVVGVGAGPVTLDRCRFDGNTAGARIPVASSGTTAFSTGCSRVNNLPASL